MSVIIVYTYEELNDMRYEQLDEIRRANIDKLEVMEKDRQRMIQNVLTLQARITELIGEK